MSIRRFLFVLVAGLSLAQPAHAQLDKPDPPPDSSDPWYRQQLVQLSEVLGGTHYLYTLCTNNQGDQRWRDYERGVIQRAPDYSDALVEAFNRGYNNQRQRFSTCDPTAQQMESELRASGLRLSQGLSVRGAQ